MNIWSVSFWQKPRGGGGRELFSASRRNESSMYQFWVLQSRWIFIDWAVPARYWQGNQCMYPISRWLYSSRHLEGKASKRGWHLGFIHDLIMELLCGREANYQLFAPGFAKAKEGPSGMRFQQKGVLSILCYWTERGEWRKAGAGCGNLFSCFHCSKSWPTFSIRSPHL